jgi:hypothetical protein
VLTEGAAVGTHRQKNECDRKQRAIFAILISNLIAMRSAR